jgi:chromate transporter
MTIWFLIIQFILVGAITFGGGLVAITLLFDIFVKTGLISETLYFQMLTVSESTPGPIAINIATYLGFNQFGIAGGVMATFAFIFPSLIILWIIFPWYQNHRQSRYVVNLLTWLRAAVLGLIFVTIVRMFFKVVTLATPVILPSIVLATLTILLLPKLKSRPYALIAIGAAFGMLFL